MSTALMAWSPTAPAVTEFDQPDPIDETAATLARLGV
jgi:hypothetical protein